MSKTNCINCGAAKDIDEIKCPFCGTNYLDFTAIDFSSDDPAVCQFVLPYSEPRTILSMLAIPRLNSITAEPSYYEMYGGFGSRPLARVNTGLDINFAVEFKPVARQSDNTLFSVKTEPKPP